MKSLMKTRKQKETGEKEVHLLEQKGYERMVNETQLYTLMYQSQNVKVLITITCLRYKVTKSFVYLLATNI